MFAIFAFFPHDPAKKVTAKIFSAKIYSSGEIIDTNTAYRIRYNIESC